MSFRIFKSVTILLSALLLVVFGLMPVKADSNLVINPTQFTFKFSTADSNKFQTNFANNLSADLKFKISLSPDSLKTIADDKVFIGLVDPTEVELKNNTSEITIPANGTKQETFIIKISKDSPDFNIMIPVILTQEAGNQNLTDTTNQLQLNVVNQHSTGPQIQPVQIIAIILIISATIFGVALIISLTRKKSN